RTTPPAVTNGQQVVSTVVDLSAIDAASGAPVTVFSPRAAVTLTVSGPTPVGVFSFDSTTSTWQPADGGSTVNPTTSSITGITSHFSMFAALTAPASLPLPPIVLGCSDSSPATGGTPALTNYNVLSDA